MRLKYEPASVPQHISVKWLFLDWDEHAAVHVERCVHRVRPQPATPSSSSLLLSSLELSDTTLYEPQIRARLGTTAHFCEVVVLRLGRTCGSAS